jgi:hypothetical protein
MVVGCWLLAVGGEIIAAGGRCYAVVPYRSQGSEQYHCNINIILQ